MSEDYAVDFYCGLGGWAEGFLAEGIKVIGFDIERHDYGIGGYPGQLVIQDVLSLHGSQFKDALCLVASPPCTEYSYMAMPWKRAKQIAGALREEVPFPKDYKGSRTLEQLNALFNACFRLQREASEAAGRHIPLIVENVKGAQPWVGWAQANFGSFYLWGDVGMVGNRVIVLNGPLRDAGLRPRSRAQKVPGFRFDGSGRSFQSAAVRGTHGHSENGEGNEQRRNLDCDAICDSNPERNGAPSFLLSGTKSAGQNWSRFAKTGEVSPHWRMEAIENERGTFGWKTQDHLNIRDGESHTRHLTNPAEHVKGFNGVASGRGNLGKNQLGRLAWSTSPLRKAASAAIAKIPFPLANYIARSFKP